MSTRKKTSLSTRTNPFGEKYIHELAKKSFTTVDSVSLFRARFGDELFQDDGFYVFAGTDCGLLVKYILNSTIPPSVKIVFVERPEIITWLGHHYRDLALPDNVSIVTFADLPHQLRSFNINTYILLDKLFFIPSLCTQYGHYRPYSRFAAEIQEYIKTLHWNIRIDLDRKDFIVGQLENLAENKIKSVILDNLFQGHTAVLLAGGPSLDDIVQWVKINRDGLVVFAVSRIAKRLLRADITPDFFITVHTQPISFDVSKEIFNFQETAILISHSQACPRLIGQWYGRHVYMGHLFPWQSQHNAASQDLVGPTVSHAAFDKIVKMGFSTIVLGGVDLCFSSQNKSHAQGSIEFEHTSQLEGGDVRVRTNGGQLAETTFAFQRGIIEFGKLAQMARDKGCRVFNPSFTSAVIAGVERVDLEKIPLSLPQKSMERAASLIDSSANTDHSHLLLVLDELEKAQKTIAILRNLALAGFGETRKLLEDKRENFPAADILPVEEILKEIEAQEHNWLFQVIHSFGIHFFTSLLSPVADKGTIDKDFLLTRKLQFTALIVTADRFKAVVDSAHTRGKMRIEETATETDLEAVTQQWAQDKQPGRALTYLHKKAITIEKLADSWQEVFANLNQQYLRQFSNEATVPLSLQATTEWTTARLHKLRKRIFSAFAAKENETLTKIIQSLAEAPTEKTGSILFLAQGLHSELNNDIQTALSWYNRIIEEDDQTQKVFLEDGLSRIASISLSVKDLPNAQLALQCLADMSVSYLPRLAEFYYITGQTNSALEAYADYLERVPDDCQTMLKLGQIYKDLNSREGVKMVADYVLERDPGNLTALHLRHYLETTLS